VSSPYVKGSAALDRSAMETVPGSALVAWLQSGPSDRAQRIVGCRYAGAGDQEIREIQGWDGTFFLTQSETGRGPLMTVLPRTLSGFRVTIPSVRRAMIGQIMSIGSETWNAVADAYARERGLGQVVGEARTDLISRMHQALGAFEEGAVVRAAGLDPEMLIRWCVAAQTIISGRMLTLGSIDQISREFTEQGWFRASALLTGWAWEEYGRVRDLDRAMDGWRRSGNPEAAICIYEHFAGARLAGGAVAAVVHCTAGWLLREAGRRDDALKAVILSWAADQTAPAACLYAVLAEDVGDAAGCAAWKHRADVIAGRTGEPEDAPSP
jgi:hypothetical protein